jgi:hypothetical protein
MAALAGGTAARRRIPEHVSLDELITGSADPVVPVVVLRPPRHALLVAFAAAVAAFGILLAESVAVKTAALSVAGLVLLVLMSKVPRGPAPGA